MGCGSVDDDNRAFPRQSDSPMTSSTVPANLTPAMLTVADAQREMRYAYYEGAPGMLISGLVWAVAAFVALRVSPERAIWTLFIGGMLIHPGAVLLRRLLGRRGTHLPTNPLGVLALATTFWMILCLPLAYAASRLHIEWFFPAMLFVIGGRYLTFSTLFGLRIYWACGGALVVAGYLLGRGLVAPVGAALAGALIEIIFAGIIFATARGAVEAAPQAVQRG